MDDQAQPDDGRSGFALTVRVPRWHHPLRVPDREELIAGHHGA
jgi:hypothetical protein